MVEKKEKERGLGGENRKKPQKEMFSRKDIASEKEMNNSGGHNNISGARRRSNNRFFWFLVIGVLIFYVGVAWGKKQSEPGNSPMEDISSFVNELSNPKSLLKNAEKDKPEKVDFGVFWDAWQVVDSKYINADQIKPQERVYGAIEGMLEATGDPYTNFMNPQETKTFNTDMEGSFEGIGAEIGIRDDTLTIVAPIDGMPAEEAGLKSGDKVMKINGESTADLAIDEAVKKIRGPKGTEVTLTIFREGESETQDIKIKRDEIDLQSVRYEKKDGNIAYIQIVSFSEDTAKEFNKEITKAIADGSEGIVLDLRNNPGGYLNVAVEVASKFISRGEVVVQEKKKNGDVTKLKAIGGSNLSEVPVTVLINEGSASASEILAGALRDQKGSTLVGKQSFGKGSVQQLENLDDGSSLKITVAEWLTPAGDSINEKGLSPDIEVELSEEDVENQNDAQLNRALEEIKKKME